jgi:TRAP-type transport system small permease protein
VKASAISTRMVELLTKLERLVIAGLMAAITILTLAQVFWRYILELPLQWSEEIARYCFVWVTFLGAATLMRLQDGHPAIDALYVRVSSKAQQVMDVVSKLMVVVGSLAIAEGGLRLVLLQWHQLSPSVEIPMAWIYMVIFLGPLIGVFWVIWCARYGRVEDPS